MFVAIWIYDAVQKEDSTDSKTLSNHVAVLGKQLCKNTSIRPVGITKMASPPDPLKIKATLAESILQEKI